MANKRQIAADILEWGQNQVPPVGRLLRLKDISAYAGWSLKQSQRLMMGVPHVGGAKTYFYTDVADRLVIGIEY